MLRKSNHITLKIFIALIAMQILNLSVDAVDFNPLKPNAVSTFNYYNSVVEYISEMVLQRDVFPESPSKTSKDSQLIKHLSFKIFQPKTLNTASSKGELAANSFGILFKEDYRFQFYKEINPPPPKA